MIVKTTTFSFGRVQNTVLEPFAKRLQEYGYVPGTLKSSTYQDDRGHSRSIHLFEFVAGTKGEMRVTFLVARSWYRIKIEDGPNLIFRSPHYVCATRWERPFLYFFNDDRPIYAPRESVAEARARRKAEDKEAGIG